VATGLMMVVGTLFELVVFPTQGLNEWRGLLPKDDQALKVELTRAFLSYLNVEGHAPANRA